jgi:ribosomal protein L10
MLRTRRKYYLHTVYANLLLRHPVILFINNNGVDAHTIYGLRLAMREYGADCKFIRRRLFVSALRVVNYIEEARVRPYQLWDPSGLAIRSKLLARKRTGEEYEMRNLLKGSQALAVFFNDFNWRPSSIDPAKIAAVIRLVEQTEKATIIGARFQRKVATAQDLQRLKTMTTHECTCQEVFGVLRRRAKELVGTLTAPAGKLAITLEGRAKK